MQVPRFTARASDNGLYNSLANKIKNDQKSLAIISPDDDLTPFRSAPWSKKCNYTTRFYQRGTTDEAVVHLFGETLGPMDGSNLGALGGTTLRPGQTVDDNNSLRDVIALDVPTEVTEDLKVLYMDQVAALNTIYLMDLGFDGERRDWLKKTPAHEESQVICVALPHKYQKPPEEPKSRFVKRRKTEEDMDTSDVHEKPKHFETRPNHHLISLTSSYSPSLLDDFNPQVMQFKTCRLMQQPLYDSRNRLIPPWEMQETLRQGTLLMIEAQLNVHHFPSTGYNTYQIIASKVRVLAKSPTPFQPPKPSEPPSDIFDELSEIIKEESSTSEEEVTSTLDSGEGPSKRRHKK